jgi:hypothetical protein
MRDESPYGRREGRRSKRCDVLRRDVVMSQSRRMRGRQTFVSVVVLPQPHEPPNVPPRRSLRHFLRDSSEARLMYHYIL